MPGWRWREGEGERTHFRIIGFCFGASAVEDLTEARGQKSLNYYFQSLSEGKRKRFRLPRLISGTCALHL